MPIHQSSRQPYTGKIVDDDPISSKLPFIGQLNPFIEERWMLSQGRSVAGLGMVAEEYQEERHDDYVQEIESDDDVLGSGIFDMSGRPGTTNPNMGVFADHPSLPGWVARSVDFAVSKEVVDLPSGADVVFVPGGGLAYVERGGRLVGPLRTDDHNNPYVEIAPTRHVAESDSSWVPVGPIRDSGPLPRGVAMNNPGGTTTVPDTREEVAMQPTVDAFSAGNPQYGVAYQRNMPAVGDDTTTATAAKPWGAYLVAGAVVGVGAAIFLGTVRMPGRGRRRRA